MMAGCQKKLDVLIKCGDIDTKRYEGINHFQRAIDMEIVETVTIPTMADLDPKCCGEACDPNQPAKMSIDDKKCVGIVYGKKCLPDQDKWLQTFAEISRNFLRPTVIRRFAQEFTEKVIGNRPYLFVHWRYESDWLDMCKPSRPKGARERNKEICKLIMGLTYDEATRSMFVNNLKAKMTEFNLEVVYLASPPNNIDLIRLLNSSFPGNFFYMDDVGKYSNSTGTFGPPREVCTGKNRHRKSAFSSHRYKRKKHISPHVYFLKCSKGMEAHFSKPGHPVKFSFCKFKRRNVNNRCNVTLKNGSSKIEYKSCSHHLVKKSQDKAVRFK